MVNIVPDPTDPNRLMLTVTASLFVDKILLTTLSEELEAAIRAQAKEDITSNKEVRTAVARAALARLLTMLDQPAAAAAVADDVEFTRKAEVA